LFCQCAKYFVTNVFLIQLRFHGEFWICVLLLYTELLIVPCPKNQITQTIILPVVLHVYGIWFLSSKTEERLRAYENRARGIYGLKKR
jgi:hypothetical protein